MPSWLASLIKPITALFQKWGPVIAAHVAGRHAERKDQRIKQLEAENVALKHALALAKARLAELGDAEFGDGVRVDRETGALLRD
ncbi:MAG: hypothetical protein AAGC77_06455 [Pseudomonadota bacterium]